MTTLGALGEDRAVVAAVIAPWTAPPAGAIDLLAAHGRTGRLALVGVGSAARWRRGLALAGGGAGAGGRAPAVDGRRGSGGRDPLPRRRRTSDQPRSPRDGRAAGSSGGRPGRRDGRHGRRRRRADRRPGRRPDRGRGLPGPRVDGRDRGRRRRSSPGCRRTRRSWSAPRGSRTDDGLALATAGRDVITACACVSVNLSRSREHSDSCTISRPRAAPRPGRSRWRPTTPAGSCWASSPEREATICGRRWPLRSRNRPSSRASRARYRFEPDGSTGTGHPPGGRVACHGLSLAAGRTPRRCSRLTALPGDRSCPIVRPKGARSRAPVHRPKGEHMKAWFPTDRRCSMGVLALVAAGCGEDTRPPTAGTATTRPTRPSAPRYDTERGRPARADLLRERDPRLDGPRVPAPVGAEPGDG